MPGRRTLTHEELDAFGTWVPDHVPRFRERPGEDARDRFEPACASDLLAALDRRSRPDEQCRPESSVLGSRTGEPVGPTVDDAERPALAALDELGTESTE